MKRNILVFLFILLLIPAAQGEAQNEISAIESLTAENNFQIIIDCTSFHLVDIQAHLIHSFFG